MENRRGRGELCDRLKGRLLLQAGELPMAQLIPYPEKIPQQDLQTLINLGQAYINSRPEIIAVAFTEFPQDFFSMSGANPSYNHIIYTSHIENKKKYVPLPGSLWLNLNIESIENNPYVAYEGCGSIADAKIGMFIRRNHNILFTGYVYNPKSDDKALKKVKGVAKLGQGGLLQHEHCHLLGKTALDKPEMIVNPDKVNLPLTDLNKLFKALINAEQPHVLQYQDNQLMVFDLRKIEPPQPYDDWLRSRGST